MIQPTNLSTYWKALDAQYVKLQDDYLTWCKMVSEMPDKQKEIAQRYDVSMGVVGKWVMIGKSADYFLRITKSIPKSQEAIYMLATLPTDQHRDDLLAEHPKPTQAQVKEYKKSLSPPVSKPATPRKIGLSDTQRYELSMMSDMNWRDGLEEREQEVSEREARIRTAEFRQAVPESSFSEEEVKLIRGCLHTDSQSSESRMTRAFTAFNRVYGRTQC